MPIPFPPAPSAPSADSIASAKAAAQLEFVRAVLAQDTADVLTIVRAVEAMTLGSVLNVIDALRSVEPWEFREIVARRLSEWDFAEQLLELLDVVERCGVDVAKRWVKRVGEIQGRSAK
jgi:hypothetical protein